MPLATLHPTNWIVSIPCGVALATERVLIVLESFLGQAISNAASILSFDKVLSKDCSFPRDFLTSSVASLSCHALMVIILLISWLSGTTVSFLLSFSLVGSGGSKQAVSVES